jgi:hypothetical protein
MGWHLQRFADAPAFLDAVGPWLMQHEAQNNLVLGLAASIASGAYETLPYLACVVRDGSVVMAALCTPPHSLVLALTTDPAALPLLLEDVSTECPGLPGVQGAPAEAEPFARLWSQKHGLGFTLKTAMHTYELRQVVPPPPIAGDYRAAAPDDLELLTDWLMAFNQEAMQIQRTYDETARQARWRVPAQADRGFRLWCVAGRPVSMAGYTGPTPNGIRVNAVYTPPEYRGHGYASACVATLSQEMLDHGRKQCFLYTDAANPTSNHIYQQIGYRHVGDACDYTFHQEHQA